MYIRVLNKIQMLTIQVKFFHDTAFNYTNVPPLTVKTTLECAASMKVMISNQHFFIIA